MISGEKEFTPKSAYIFIKLKFSLTTFALYFLEFYTGRMQKWDKTNNLRQNTTGSEQKFTPENSDTTAYFQPGGCSK